MQTITSYFETGITLFRSHLRPMAIYCLLLLGVLLLSLLIQQLFISIEIRGGQLYVDRSDIVWSIINRTLTGILLIWVSIGLIRTTYEMVTGVQVTPVQTTMRAMLPHLIPAVLLSLLTTIAIFFGLLILVIPGLVFSVWLSFVLYSLVIEGRGVFESFTRSKSLMHGRFWPVLARLAVFFVAIALVLIVVNVVLTFILSLISLESLAELMIFGLSVITTPLVTLLITMLYTELAAGPPTNTEPRTIDT